jgi:hypothetical protein
VKDHIEAEVNHFRRGKKHSDPDKEEDVSLLQASYAVSRIHTYIPKRYLHGENQVQDYLAKGSNPDTLRKVVSNWLKKRVTTKGTMEDHDTVSDTDDNSDS